MSGINPLSEYAYYDKVHDLMSCHTLGLNGWLVYASGCHMNTFIVDLLTFLFSFDGMWE